jgi:antitoxin component YwqK of YwqJK toxin-antitoxin module
MKNFQNYLIAIIIVVLSLKVISAQTNDITLGDSLYKARSEYNIPNFIGPWYYPGAENKGQEKVSTKGNLINGRPEGEYSTYYRDGQLAKKENYKNGRAEGEYLIYFSNGHLEGKGNYKNGGKEGECLEYYNNGRLGERGNYKNEKDGGEYVLGLWNANVIIIAENTMSMRENAEKKFRSGEVSKRENYNNGKQEGKQIEYFRNGEVRKIAYYKSGEFEGDSSFFYSGQLQSIRIKKNGFFDTKSFSYYKSGKIGGEVYCDHNKLGYRLWYYDTGELKEKITNLPKKDTEELQLEAEKLSFDKNGKLLERGNGKFRYGAEEGEWILYYMNGQIKAKGNYSDGQKDGVWFYYDINGKLYDTRREEPSICGNGNVEM